MAAISIGNSNRFAILLLRSFMRVMFDAVHDFPQAQLRDVADSLALTKRDWWDLFTTGVWVEESPYTICRVFDFYHFTVFRGPPTC